MHLDAFEWKSKHVVSHELQSRDCGDSVKKYWSLEIALILIFLRRQLSILTDHEVQSSHCGDSIKLYWSLEFVIVVI